MPRPARAAWLLLAGAMAIGCGQESRATGADGRARAAPDSTDAPAATLSRSVALTFDDLPGVFLDTALGVARDANERLLAALRDRRASATGFVNEAKLRGSDARAAILEAWLDAGMDLGNHTFSHPDLHRIPLDAFRDDVLRGERVTRALMAGRGLEPRFFRHPFLHTGRSVPVRDSLVTFLGAHGYAVAPVTIDNYDYIFARAYDRALTSGDSSAARRIADEYVAYMDTVFGFYEAQSRSLFEREPAQVLLLHVSRLNADHIDALLAMMRDRDYRVVPLDSALADPIYRSEDRYTGPAGITWLHRWAITRGTPGSAFAGEPVVPDWIEALVR
jgi:peptidoglycan/xylan/chitin deacetylase (PgdA/CDA1 family)